MVAPAASSAVEKEKEVVKEEEKAEEADVDIIY